MIEDKKKKNTVQPKSHSKTSSRENPRSLREPPVQRAFLLGFNHKNLIEGLVIQKCPLFLCNMPRPCNIPAQWDTLL